MDKREGTATSQAGLKLEKRVMCFHQVFAPKGYPHITADGRRTLAPLGYGTHIMEGQGNCCECKPDPENNRHCSGYSPTTVTLYAFGVKPQHGGSSQRQAFLEDFYNGRMHSSPREKLEICCQQLGMPVPDINSAEEVKARQILLEAEIVRRYCPQ